MSGKKILTEIITRDAEIQSLISARFQPQESPRNAGFPRISYSRLSSDFMNPLNDNPDFEVVTEVIEILCHDLTDIGADDLASMVKDNLEQWVRDNVLESGTAAGYDVTNIWFTDRSDEPTRPLLKDQSPNYTDVLTCNISYRRGFNQ